MNLYIMRAWASNYLIVMVKRIGYRPFNKVFTQFITDTKEMFINRLCSYFSVIILFIYYEILCKYYVH